MNICFSKFCEATLDVIVVGGGLSALTTAYRLSQGGLKVKVLDGDENLGGRTRSHIYHGNSVSIGGTWALFENRFSLELANEVNAMPFVPDVIPKELAVSRIATHPYLLLQLWLIGNEMSSLRADYWNSEGAKELDNMSIEQWLQHQKQSYQWPPDALQAVRDWFWLMENFPPIQSNISALFGSVMLYKRTRSLSAEGLYLKGVFRWENGTGTFINAIADAILRLGGSISTSSQVTAIDYSTPKQVIVTLATGETVFAKKVVIFCHFTTQF